MMALPQKIAFDGLRGGLSTVNNEFHRLNQIAGIGLGAAALWQQRTFTVQLETLAKNAKWWEQLRLLVIPFEEDRFRTEDGYVRQIIPKLLQKTSFDIITALEFAQDYNIEGEFEKREEVFLIIHRIDDFVILEYIKSLLKEPGSETDYQPRILGVLDDVVNREKLSRLLKESILALSPYDYERLRFVFTVIAKLEPEDAIAKKAFLILDILDLYVRTRSPTLQEFQSHRSSPVNKTLEDLTRLYAGCEKRLPYHTLVVSPWSVLEEELNDETLGRLLPIAIPLNLQHNQFYMIVVEKQIKKMVGV